MVSWRFALLALTTLATVVSVNIDKGFWPDYSTPHQTKTNRPVAPLRTTGLLKTDRGVITPG